MAVLDLERPVEPQPKPQRKRRRPSDWRQPRLPTMAHYLAFLQSGWIVLTILTVLGAVAGAAYASSVPREWEASASIELPDLPMYVDLTSEGPPPKRTSIDTTGQLVFSEQVLEAVAAANGISRQEAFDALSISAYPLSRVIIVTMKAPSEKKAISGANAAARTLADERGNLLAGGSNRQAARELAADLRDRNQDFIDENGGSNASVRISQQVQNIFDNLARYANNKAKVVNKAAPGKVVPPHPEVYITTGAVSGFMLGVLWIWWRPRRRKSVEELPGVNRSF